MLNPYADVEWSTVQRVASVSHMHAGSLNSLMRAYDGGIRHFPISNYYPSAPWYPLDQKYGDVPNDAIGSPNAEHHGMTNGKPNFHFNGVGSFYDSGEKVNKRWQEAFSICLSQLQYDDGGGITINHPTWSGLDFSDVLQLLDFDHRVLGIEIFNHSSQLSNGSGWALTMWDAVLMTGRRCWGFCVSDHAHNTNPDGWLGRSILLLPELTEHSALKAYRDGAFYGALVGSGLTFQSITATSSQITVTLDKSATIRFIVNGRVEKTVAGSSGSYDFGVSDRYVRVEATDGTETIFSQPVILRDRDEIQRMDRRKKTLLI